MVKTAADLHSSQFAVKSHCPWGVGGDFAGILLSTLAATVYKANTKVSTIDLKKRTERVRLSGNFRPQRWMSLHSPGKRSWREKKIQKKQGEGGKACRTETREKYLYNRKAFGNQFHYRWADSLFSI